MNPSDDIKPKPPERIDRSYVPPAVPPNNDTTKLFLEWATIIGNTGRSVRSHTWSPPPTWAQLR
jgi:hypothetical protein